MATKKEHEKKWNLMRNDIDEAIRAGLTAQEFMELNDISREQWYRMKPKGFKWHMIQTELKIKRKPHQKSEKITQPIPIPKPVEPIKPEKKYDPGSEKFAVVVCKGSDLKNVLTSLLD